MIIRLTATKFKPFMFPMLGFTFAIVILYDFCLLPARFSYLLNPCAGYYLKS
jgi:hypothetical protein